VVKSLLFSKKSKKKMDQWVECPDFSIKQLKKITREEEERDLLAYTVMIYAKDNKIISKLLDYMINVGNEEIIVEKIKIWLHATKFSIARNSGLHSCALTYIFRVKNLPEEILNGG